MTPQGFMAIMGTVVLGLLIVFQILLALGLPLGHMAWGGQHRILPTPQRWMSFGAVFILAFAGWMLLSRAGLVPPGAAVKWVRVWNWVSVGCFSLNVLMNAFLTQSAIERFAMTPVSLLLVLSFVLVSVARTPS